MRKKTHEIFVSQIETKFPNKFEIIDKYINAKTKIKVKHIECGHIWEVTPDNLLTGYGCPYCNGGSKRSKENFISLIEKLYPNQYEIIGEYKTAREHILVKHIECGHEWNITPDNLKRGKGCPHCNCKLPVQSKTVKQIITFLTNLNICFETEKTFSDLKFKKKLRFDFCIYDKNLNIKMLIEFDGELHFRPYKNNEKTLRVFEECQLRDKLKDDYCIKNNIKLIRFNYKQSFDEIKKILFENIKDIVQN